MKLMTRRRYSLWNAFTEIGGFHDGLKLILKTFVAPLVATMFELELLDGALISS